MIVLCLGLPGSASTLAFNVAREVLEAAGHGPVVVVEATSLGALEGALRDVPPAATVVVRAHTASHALLSLLGAAGTRWVLTARDPRDCVASLCGRLGGRAAGWCTDVARSLAAVATVQARFGIRALGYEEATGGEGRDLVRGVAERIGVPLEPDAAAGIAARWTRGAVARRVEAVAEAGTPSRFGWRTDPATGLNERHLGDGRVGKWRDALDPADRAAVDRLFGGVGEVADAPLPGRMLRFGEALFGTAARPPGTANLGAETSRGLRVLSLCFLGVGTWRLALRGGLPPAGVPRHVHLAAGGKLCASLPVPASSAPPTVAGSVLLDHRDHERQVEVLVEGGEPDARLPDPLRPGALEIEAVLT